MNNEHGGHSAKKCNPALAVVRKIKGLGREYSEICKQVASLEDLFKGKIMVRKRQMIQTECEKLAEFEEFQREALETFWRQCIYGPIYIYKTFEGQDEEDQEMLKSFISKCIAHVSNLLAQYPDMRFFLLICLGDLYRYSFIHCDKDQRDLEMSEKCYGKAAITEPTNGRSYNQLAILAKEFQPEKALFLFLRSMIQEKESAQAVKNIQMLDGSKFEKTEYRLLFDFATVFMFNFSRVQFEEARKEFDQILESPKDDLTFINLVEICSMAALYAFQNEVSDEQFRYIASFLCQKLIFLLESARKQINEAEQDEQLSKRRRQRGKRSSSSDSDEEEEEGDEEREKENENGEEDGEEEETDEETQKGGEAQRNIVLLSAICAAEFLANSGEYFMSKKLSVSLKLQFQNLLKTFVDLLNDLLAELSPLMNSDVPIPISCIIDWTMGKFLMTTSQTDEQTHLPKVVTHFLKKCTANRVCIIFDKYFKMTSTSGEKEKQTIEDISRLHLTHVNELNERASRIPVYMAPDQIVLLNNLPLLQKFSASSRQTIIVARSVLGKIDKVKKENAHARQAIRWIQNSVAAGNVRILQHTGRNFIGECMHFLDEKGLLDKQTLFMSILTSEQGQNDYQLQNSELLKCKSICVEEIHDFTKRMRELNKSSQSGGI